jgi:hypothetical protein
LVGGRETMERVARALTQAGVDVLRTGRYLGEAVGADWFIRLAEPAGQDVTALMTGILGAAATDRPVDVRSEVLGVELAAAHAREAHARAEGDRLRRDLEEHRAAADADLEALRRDVESERAARSEVGSVGPVEEPALVDHSPDARRIGPAVRTRSTKVIEKEIEAVLAALLPRARLLRDTLTVVAVEFGDRKGVYSALRELQASERGVPSAWKTLRGLDGWIERHVSTGHDDSGRAYARFDPTDRTWQVLLSHKGQQARDVAWLARR